ncbi:MAG: TonB-dependent receptor [Porticoccaceae bacterium]|nr:TonB-dependent receptor [Porticoccaceae bacterium]
MNQKEKQMYKRMKTILVSIFLTAGVLVSYVALSEDDVAELEDYTVIDVNDDLSILPSEPSEGAFGLSLPLLETPRSVTEVSADLVKTYALRSVDDLVRLTPGAFTSSFFGIRGAMDIRGQTADNYFRGFRRIDNPGAFNTIIRGAHSLEILRGPVSPLYGVGSVGGQLNYSPKTAKVDTAKYIPEATGRVDVTLGTYSQKIIAAEYGTPFTVGENQAGMYLFAEVEDSESFYHGYNPSSELIQVAFDMDFGESTYIEFGYQQQTTDSIQVPGWTRVTQDLVDNGTYITGAPHPRNDPTNPIGADRLTPQESGFMRTSPSTPGTWLNNSFSGVTNWMIPASTPDFTTPGFQYCFRGSCRDMAYFGNRDPALTNPGTAQIDHRTTFIDELDFADTTARTAYFDVVKTMDNGMVWKNQFFYDYLDHTKHQSWGFTADYPGAEIMEFRSSLTFETETDAFSSNTIVGISFRREDLDHKDAWFDENFDRRDMLVGPTPDDRIDWAVDDAWADATVLYDDDGNIIGIEGTFRRNWNEHQISLLENTGVFFLSEIDIANFNVLVGGRYDSFDVKSSENAATLMLQGFQCRDGYAADMGRDWEYRCVNGQIYTGSDSQFSYNFSVSYDTEMGLVPYITIAESTSLSVNQLGGVNPFTVEDGSYLEDSEIMEIGFKYDGLDGRLFAAVSYYDQEKTFRSAQTNALGALYGNGIEAEMRLVLSDSFSLTATATNSETTEICDGCLFVVNQAQIAEQNGMQPWELYNGRFAGARGYFIGEQVEVDRGGLPDTILSAYGSYTIPYSAGRIIASLGFTYADSTYMDFAESVLLPSYSVWTASMSYVTDSFEIMTSVNNVFDEKYYTSADLFPSTVVKPSEGTTASIIASYKF